MGKPQAALCEASIESFRTSGHFANEYILVHNRTDSKKEFRDPVIAALRTLVAEGKAGSAELWSRQTLVKKALDCCYERTLASAQLANLSNHDLHSQLETLQWEPLTEVPLSAGDLLVNQHRLIERRMSPEICADPCESIANAKEFVSILVGEAGFGKTTTAFRLVNLKARNVIYVPAASITGDTANTATFLRQAVCVDELLAGSLEEDQEIHRRLYMTVIAHVLKFSEVGLMLVIDGLDESIHFSRRGGVQHILNVLHDIAVPILITARSEFWFDKEPDFFMEAGLEGDKAPRKKKRIKFIELLRWSDERILALIGRVCDGQVTAEENRRLSQLAALVESERYFELFGDIPRRPLFLKMIIETTMERGLQKVTRAQLLRDWVIQKIIRDTRNVESLGGMRIGLTGSTGESVTQRISNAFSLMKASAVLMTQVLNSVLELVPSCKWEDLIRATRESIGPVDPIGLVLNSILIFIRDDLGAPRRLAFSHRAYQEYFLALAVDEGDLPTEGLELPTAVREWIEDIEIAKYG